MVSKFAYTTEETLDQLSIREDLDVGVMIFSGEFVINNQINIKLLNKIFPLDRSKSRIDLYVLLLS